MTAQAQKNSAAGIAHFYGAGPHYFLEETIIGAGAAAPTVPNPSTNGGPTAVPPCAAEIVTITRTSAGVYVLTFADAYYAVASWNISIDDVGAAPMISTLGQFQNLGTATPTVCTLSTYSPAGTPTDVAANNPIRISICFKKEWTGAAA